MTTEDRPMAGGIFGSGIDLSALDEQTAWRLGVLFGEQILAAEERGRQRGRAEAIADLRDDAAYHAHQMKTGIYDGGRQFLADYLEAKGHQP